MNELQRSNFIENGVKSAKTNQDRRYCELLQKPFGQNIY